MKVIEIPPPRPKRKPMHPYPRKLVNPLINTEILNEDQHRSVCQNSSVSEQEQLSPTSVLYAVGSVSTTPRPTEELGFSSPLPVADPVAIASVLNNVFLALPSLVLIYLIFSKTITVKNVLIHSANEPSFTFPPVLDY